MRADYPIAPELRVSRWFNAANPLSLAELRGRVVVLHAFQMLCPGCVSHGLPQAQALHERFSGEGVTVIGLHTVFEHHQVMSPLALAAFLHEYRYSFPIGVDQPSEDGNVPVTMRAYDLQGTPSLVLIDRHGRIRQSAFGRVDDLRLGLALGKLLSEPAPSVEPNLPTGSDPATGCDTEGCRS